MLGIILTDEFFTHYYHFFADDEEDELHAIFNYITPFPIELTKLVIGFVKVGNWDDRYHVMKASAKKEALNHEFESFARVVCRGSSAWRLDIGTWLSRSIYDSLPYSHGLPHEFVFLLLEYPKLRKRAAEVALKGVMNADLSDSFSDGWGVDDIIRADVQAYLRVVTRELYRRYCTKMLDDIIGIEIYYQ